MVLCACLLAGCYARQRQPGDPLKGLTRDQLAQWDRGRELFEREFEPEAGLGPLFNAPACGECHEEPFLGGVGDEVERHIALVRPDGTCDPLVERGGPVIQEDATPALRQALGIESEPVSADLVPAHRTTPDLLGFGLLDAVSERRILARADPDDRNCDGISGRAHRTADGKVGRFGRKAQEADLRTFNDDAILFEQGITTPRLPNENTVAGLPLPPGVDPLGDPEISDAELQAIDAFVRFLAPPEPLTFGREARRGRKLFARIGCEGCHQPILKTGRNLVDALEHQEVAAYSDLLLHDMGGELADICLGGASPSEFRTEPLMGLRFSTTFLHDGRARTIEEAIRLHGGEAARARDAFADLDGRDRAALLAFLGCL